MKPFIASCWMLFVVVAGCALDDVHENANSKREGAGPIKVLLSNQYGLGACEKWLERNSEEAFIFINAYAMDTANAYAELRRTLTEVDAVILTGGPDIHPGRYKLEAETLRCETIDLHRDQLEALMLDYVQESGVACLGICRGLQHLNIHFGGTLHPHLPDTLGNLHRAGFTRDQKLSHTHLVEVTTSPTTLLLPVGTTGQMVSIHHQGIARLAPELESWAVSPDGLREGVWHPDTAHYPFLVGIQWHPEYSDSTHVLSTAIADGFLRAIASSPLR